MKTIEESKDHEVILKVINELEGQIKAYLNLDYPEEIKKIPFYINQYSEVKDMYFSSYKTFEKDSKGRVKIALYLKKKGNFSNSYIDLIVKLKVEKHSNGFYVHIEGNRFNWPFVSCNLLLMKYLSHQFLKVELEKFDRQLSLSKN